MKVLFVGLGSIGQRHLRNLRCLMGGSVEIVAYRERRSVPLLDDQQNVIEDVSVTEKYEVREIETLEKGLSENPTAVFITNPSSMHVEVAIRAAKAGCHLFIEKPLGTRDEKIDELINLVDDKDLVALVAYQLRFHPGLQMIAGWLQDQRIGDLISAHIVNGEHLPNFHPYEDYRTSYASRNELGGGCILSQIHEFDYIYSLFGTVRRLFSLGGKLSNLEIDVEDTASILMECTSHGMRFPLSLNLNFVQLPTTRTCTIIGALGRIDWDLHNGSLELQTIKSTTIERYDYSNLDRNDLFLAELRHFLDCVAGRCQPVVDLRSGYVSLQMALAALASIENGKVQVLS